MSGPVIAHTELISHGLAAKDMRKEYFWNFIFYNVKYHFLSSTSKISMLAGCSPNTWKKTEMLAEKLNDEHLIPVVNSFDYLERRTMPIYSSSGRFRGNI